MNRNTDIFIAQSESLDALLENLSNFASKGSSEVDALGFVSCKDCADSVLKQAHPFALQVLPYAEKVSAASAAAWGELLASKILKAFANKIVPWRLHIFTIGKNGDPLVSKYCCLIEERAKKSISKENKELLGQCVRDHSRTWSKKEKVAQLFIAENSTGYLSIENARASEHSPQLISRFPGGMIKIKSDRRPPSRAYQKLLELELRLGRSIKAGERCVDLGASPGGWSFIALERGANVVAIDRSPLREDLMRHPKLKFIKGDGFKYKPEAQVEWMLCDVAAYPEKSIELLSFWLSNKLCKNFAVTLKLKGDQDYSVIERAQKIVGEHCSEFYIQHLLVNKNEISVFGVATP